MRIEVNNGEACGISGTRVNKAEFPVFEFFVPRVYQLLFPDHEEFPNEIKL